VRLLLDERPELSVVGEAADGQELVTQMGRLQPDIILLDQDLPGWSPAILADAFQALDRRPRVIVLGTHAKTLDTVEMAGADAYVSKGDPPKRLLAAIHALSVEDLT
jgi:DNA-binding NarL/FixJ family response regulator